MKKSNFHGNSKKPEIEVNKPRHFITVTLYNADLARDLEKHGVKCSHGETAA